MILYLSTKGGIVPSSEISEKMGIPRSYVLKIAKRRGNSGYTTTHIGIHGGTSVRKAANEINLLNIIQVMENTTKLNRCLEEDRYCSRFATESCPVRNFYCVLQEELETKLSSITVATLIEGSKCKKERNKKQ